MAFNSFDKLRKAQRDYSNPKFATQAVEKALKKQPNSPYLLTWKADLALRQNPGQLCSAAQNLVNAQKQPIVDTELLVYMYRTLVELLRRSKQEASVNSIGAPALSTWQKTAKSMKSKRDRTALWDLLFITAMEEDCWEDARLAIVYQTKEGTLERKQSFYALIIATALAAEQRQVSDGLDDPMAKVQHNLAFKMIKQAYQAPSDDDIAVKSIRELRFMAEVVSRQRRYSELHDLWDNPTAEMEPLMNRHRTDIVNLTTHYLWRQKSWAELEAHCLTIIDETLSNLHFVGGSRSNFWELCAWRWDIWCGLISALHAGRTKEEKNQMLSNQLQKCFPSGIDAKDRPIRLTYIRLRDEIGISMLEDCKTYYRHFSSTPSCFNDLKDIVCRLPAGELLNFKTFVSEQAMGYMLEAQTDEQFFETSWCQRHVVWLKFQFLFAVLHSPSIRKYHDVFRSAIKWLSLHLRDPDAAFVAVYTLLKLDAMYVHLDASSNPLESPLNSRLLLQAAMLARHQMEKDKNEKAKEKKEKYKPDKTISLLAARLHLNLGLGTVAFRAYSHAKCKEMLLDTLSPYVLSRISQTHPFDVKGYGGFSADDELAKVISTIDRMEKKTGSYLFTDISSFKWDQATEILRLKRKLSSSLTKHICVVERRRIARFKGESTDALPELSYMALKLVSDNIDRSVFPDFDIPCGSTGVLGLVMPNPMPDVRSFFHDCLYREHSSQVLHNERQGDDYGLLLYALSSNPAARIPLETVRTEELMSGFWKHINLLTQAIEAPDKYNTAGEESQHLMRDLIASREIFSRLRMPGNTTLDPVDEPTMCHENMLMWCYGFFEVSRALVKLADRIKDKVMNTKGKNKPHPLKQCLATTYAEDLKREGEISFETVRDVAQSYLELVKRRGLVAIKAQVRWGITGEQLKNILSDQDVEYYANEYVDSMVEAWNGVLKVKFK